MQGRATAGRGRAGPPRWARGGHQGLPFSPSPPWSINSPALAGKHVSSGSSPGLSLGARGAQEREAPFRLWDRRSEAGRQGVLVPDHNHPPARSHHGTRAGKMEAWPVQSPRCGRRLGGAGRLSSLMHNPPPSPAGLLLGLDAFQGLFSPVTFKIFSLTTPASWAQTHNPLPFVFGQ